MAPIVTRGVLLDVALGALPAGYAVTAAELERAAAGVELRPGDVVLVRLGSGALWADRAGLPGGGRDDRRRLALAGGAPPARGRRRQPRVGPPGRAATRSSGSLPGHTILIVQEGIHIIESLFLEELAADGVREFGFVCLPLKLRGGTGSPVRPIALV